MALIKICPSCGFANPVSEMMCQECATFIADALPVEDNREKQSGETPQDLSANSAATIRLSNSVTFCDETGIPAFSAKDGDEIGRRFVGAEYFANMLTVSRRHCKISLASEGWLIEDLESSNGTWLNGDRISGPRPLKNGDSVGFYQSCVLRVQI